MHLAGEGTVLTEHLCFGVFPFAVPYLCQVLETGAAGRRQGVSPEN